MATALRPSKSLLPSKSVFPSKGGGPQDIAVAREFPPDDLAVRISDPRTGHTVARLAADEGNAENVINDLAKSSEMQGGCKESSGTLPRSPRIRWSDLDPYLDKTIYGPGVDEVWWGRIDKPQGSEGSQTLVEPKGVGHLAALEDNTAILGLGFINADQTQWGDPSTERRKRLIEAAISLVASTSFGFASKQEEKQPPGVINDFTNVSAVEGKDEAGEAHFDSGGVDIDAVLYDYRQLSALKEDVDWESNMGVGTTDTFDVNALSPDHNRTTALEQRVEAPGAGYQYARLRDRYTGAFTGPLGDLIAWQNIRVLARTGLALKGTWPNVGYTAKQMLEYAVPRYSYLSALAEDIDDDGFVIPHAWFSEPGDLATVVRELTKYGLLDWFVKDGKRLQLRFPGTYGRRWVAAPGPAELSEDGEDGTRLWREIVVAFQDVDGTTKYVGPPGSGATYEWPGLEITDPDHPAVRAGITRRDLLVTKSVGDLPSSIKLGENWLEAANELSKSGSCNLSGYVMDDRGILRPAAQVEAGDEVFFPGATDSSYRRITSVEYQHPERKAACKLDAPPDGLAAIQERFQVELKSWGIG